MLDPADECRPDLVGIPVGSMLDTGASAIQAVDDLQDEAVRKLSELIRIPSVNPDYPGVDRLANVGGERAANAYLQQEYRRLGLETDVWEEVEGRSNVVGRWPGAGNGRSLKFSGHVDTVSVGKHEDWQDGNPFSGRVENGNVFGRGACDMKGGLIAQLVAVDALRRAGVRLGGDLYLESVSGEETGQYELGCVSSLTRGHGADAAVVAEPTSGTLGLSVSPVSCGMFLLAVTCSGKATHASARREFIRAGGAGDAVGVNAIEKTIYLIQAIRQLEDQWGITKRHPLFPAGHFTLHPGEIRGGPFNGTSPIIVSEYCTVQYNILFPPQESAQAIQQEITNHVMAAASMDTWLRDHPPQLEWRLHLPATNVGAEHPISQSAGRAHARAIVDFPRLRDTPTFQGFFSVCDASF
ncbi:MAG: M20/M25/M40 family metallo-hydrolase, partial [Chloroflexi bacterium]|nr:M20/M25/M40 family metallo-hydrolase [Chloroflexota bacterium]